MVCYNNYKYYIICLGNIYIVKILYYIVIHLYSKIAINYTNSY